MSTRHVYDHSKGEGMGNRGPKKAVIFRAIPSNGPRNGRAQKVSIFRAHPFQWPLEWMGGGPGGEGAVRSVFTSYRSQPPPPQALESDRTV
jgi:hypothetical protein